MKRPIYLYITPFFPSVAKWEGAYCYDAVKALIENGKYDIRVFTGGNGEDYEYNGIVVHTFKTRELPSAIFPFLFAKWNQKSFLAAVRRTCIDTDQVAICHAHTATYGIYALLLKGLNKNCLTLLHHHDMASFGLNIGCMRHFWLYNLIQFPILRRMHEKIDCHVFVSEASRRSFLFAPDTSWSVYPDYKKQMRGLPYRRVKIKNSLILHNGVDVGLFKPQIIQRAQGGFTIGCIGNFQVPKGQMVLLKAVEILGRRGRIMGDGRVKVVFVGSGSEKAKCEKYAKEKGLDVEFRSEVRHEELVDFYRTLDLFVLPSYFEGFGCVYAEAWACGVPFIACEGQGIADLIPEVDRVKWLVQPNDAGSLARAIDNFLLYHPKQYLSGEIAIKPLIEEFVCNLSRIRI